MDPTSFSLDWFKQLTIEDELHVAAIDNLLLDKNNRINLAGITKIDGRWIPIVGDHSIIFSGDGADAGHLKINCSMKEKNRIYKIETSGKSAIRTIFKILNANRITISNDAFISAIDNFILNERKLIQTGNYVADVVPSPMDGIYILMTKSGDSYMIAKRKTGKSDKESSTEKSYIVDIVGDFYINKLKSILNGDANRIRVVNCTVINEQINVRVMNKPPLSTIHKCQQTIVDFTINTYKNKADKNVTILVSGAPGLGKSTVAFLIAQKVKEELGVDPYLIKGFNVMSEQMQYHPVIGFYNPSNTCPIVLLLDEFDLAMKRADGLRADGGNDDNERDMSHAIAANKTNLNNFLDAVNDESFLIVVATSNMSIKDIKANFGVYCRAGRFTKHFEMVNRDETLIYDP